MKNALNQSNIYLRQYNMQCKVLRANEDGDLELATLIVQTNKEVIAIIEIS